MDGKSELKFDKNIQQIHGIILKTISYDQEKNDLTYFVHGITSLNKLAKLRR